MTGDPTRAVWDALAAADCNPSGEPWRGAARCPAHADNNASLSIGVGADGRALVFCHRGCEPAAVVAALGLTWQDMFPPGHRHAAPLRGIGRQTPMLELVLAALAELAIGHRATRNPQMWVADQCPACALRGPAPLWIVEDDRGRVTLSCAAGCDQVVMLDALAGVREAAS